VLKDNVIESIEDDSKAFDRLVEMAVYLITTNEPVIKRAGILRNQAKMESIPLSSKDVFLILAKARRDIEGIDEGEKPNVELDVSEESWLWDQLITEANLTLIVSMPKVGKSSLVGAFLGQLSSGSTEYLGKEIKGEKRSIYIVGSDQPLNDWVKILIPAGLAERTASGKVILKEPLKRLWHKGKPLHLTEESIELLYGIALAATKATPILLHHASGGNSGERAVKASRGTKALPAEASQILELDWLIPEDKHDNRVTISSAGRNSTPVDMVIEQVDRAVWVNLGSKSEIAENLRLEKVREKLNDRQELVLTFLEQRDEKNKGMFTTSQDLVENLKSEFEGDNTKALSTLNQLENKKLIYSKYQNFEGKGRCRIFKWLW